MKFKISQQRTKGKPTVELCLEKSGDGRVAVRGTGSDGIEWCLVEFVPDGTIHRNISIGNDLGFQLDNAGRIELDKD